MQIRKFHYYDAVFSLLTLTNDPDAYKMPWMLLDSVCERLCGVVTIITRLHVIQIHCFPKRIKEYNTEGTFLPSIVKYHELLFVRHT